MDSAMRSIITNLLWRSARDEYRH